MTAKDSLHEPVAPAARGRADAPPKPDDNGTPRSSMSDYTGRRDRLIEQLAATRGSVRLGKATSNLYRDRTEQPHDRLEVGDFNHVLDIDTTAGWIDAEGMTPYATLAAAALEHGVMPCVVPQLKSITIGGAVAGVGIESSSFKYGLVHETLLELEVLLGDGTVVLARPDNEHRDLFYGFPNSYGTLGYALRVRAQAVPVRPYVRLEHVHHRTAEAFFGNLAALCAAPVDFVDGVVFGANDLVATAGRFVDAAPYTSDYTYHHIYYRSLREREEDYLSARDYLWRWDTDWFWCSKNVYAQNPVVRLLLGRKRLNSIFYTKVMRWNSRLGLTRWLDQLSGKYPESVIQDVDIPLDRAAEFLDFFLREIGILPAWICPFRPSGEWTLFPTRPGVLYINFGFWDVIRSREPRAIGHYNRLIERKVTELGGVKSLYSDSFYPRGEFWSLYNGSAYEALKARYDPQRRFKDLYDKCVLRR